MKRLKRRLSAAFRGNNANNNNNITLSSAYFDADCPSRNSILVGTNHLPNGGSMSMQRGATLSESMSQLADRLAVGGVIMEECVDPSFMLRSTHGKPAGRRGYTQGEYPAEHHHRVPPPRTHSLYNPRTYHNGNVRSSAYYGSHASVVEESMVLGSDGESLEVSPCTSDQTPTGVPPRYMVKVKMRQKAARKWSEEEIQKRLSLPADLRLPVAVVEKLNRTPTLDQPLTRKNRRASLSEIGFGKLETYEKLNKLGEGSYAVVFRGRSILSNKYVALKEIRLEQEEGAPCTAIREVSLLRNLRHTNVVTLHDIIHTERLLTLVFEYVDRDLKQYMETCNNMMLMENVRLFLYQLFRGLSYCHQRRVLHRDLKPQNLLITAKGELKLADFGLARAKSVPTKTYSHEVVTLWYRPPDVLLGSTDYSTHIDMWGVGCILFEMVAGRPLFPGGSTEEQVSLIFRTMGLPRKDRHPTIVASEAFQAYANKQYHPQPLCRQIPRIDHQGNELIMKLLQYEGRDRISAAEGLKHPFLKNYYDRCSHLRDDQSVLEVEEVRLHIEPVMYEMATRIHNIHHNSRRPNARPA